MRVYSGRERTESRRRVRHGRQNRRGVKDGGKRHVKEALKIHSQLYEEEVSSEETMVEGSRGPIQDRRPPETGS